MDFETIWTRTPRFLEDDEEEEEEAFEEEEVFVAA